MVGQFIGDFENEDTFPIALVGDLGLKEIVIKNIIFWTTVGHSKNTVTAKVSLEQFYFVFRKLKSEMGY